MDASDLSYSAQLVTAIGAGMVLFGLLAVACLIARTIFRLLSLATRLAGPLTLLVMAAILLIGWLNR